MDIILLVAIFNAAFSMDLSVSYHLSFDDFTPLKVQPDSYQAKNKEHTKKTVHLSYRL